MLLAFVLTAPLAVATPLPADDDGGGDSYLPSGPRCPAQPALHVHRGAPPIPDRFDPPDADPWPGLTPGASAAAWERVADAVRSGTLPPRGAVRAEEVVQMLPPDDPPPPPGEDFVVRAEAAASPWHPDEAILRIAITTRRPRPLDRDPVHLAVVVDARTEAETGLRTVRAGIRQLASALRPDDTLALVDSSRGLLAPPAPIGDGTAIERAIDRLVAVPEDHDLPEALRRAYGTVAGRSAARVVLLSDGDLSLIEQGDELAALAATRAGVGVALTAIGVGDAHGRDESLEALARAAGGTYLHLGDENDARRVLGDYAAMLVEPVLTDVRLLVDWGPAVIGVHRMGNHHERLSGLGPSERAGRELVAGRTAVVVYEVKLAPNAAARSLGRVRVRATPVSTGVPRIAAVQLPPPGPALDRASPSMQLAAVATEFAALLEGTRPAERAGDVVSLAERSRRPEYPEDAELVEIVRLAAPLLRGPRCW